MPIVTTNHDDCVSRREYDAMVKKLKRGYELFERRVSVAVRQSRKVDKLAFGEVIAERDEWKAKVGRVLVEIARCTHEAREARGRNEHHPTRLVAS
jgi:hypothetical protein